ATVRVGLLRPPGTLARGVRGRLVGGRGIGAARRRGGGGMSRGRAILWSLLPSRADRPTHFLPPGSWGSHFSPGGAPDHSPGLTPWAMVRRPSGAEVGRTPGRAGRNGSVGQPARRKGERRPDWACACMNRATIVVLAMVSLLVAGCGVEGVDTTYG